MKVELIPVIEIRYHHQTDIKSPENGPYWEYPEEWDKYHKESFSRDGYADLGKPLLAGSTFYYVPGISEENVIKIAQNHLIDFSNGKYYLDGVCPLSGGCVLRVDGLDILFPQCCGDLGDIAYWESISDKHESEYYPGHPQPDLKIDEQKIVFSFERGEYAERFVPPPPVDEITIKKSLLKSAVIEAKLQLQTFGEMLIKINESTGMNIPHIDNLLIWDK